MDLINEHGWKAAVALFLAKEIYSIFKNDHKKSLGILDELKGAVAELKIHFGYIREDREKLEKIMGKLTEDVNLAWGEIRSIKGKSVGRGN